jgi:ribonuclease VapC
MVVILDELIDRYGIATVSVDGAQAAIAHEAFMAYGKGSGHPARLNFGDLFSYALAKSRDLPLLFKGDDFARTDIASALST